MTASCRFLWALLALAAPASASIDWDGDTSKTSEGFDTWIIAEAPYAAAAPLIDGVISPGEWDAAARNPLEAVFHIRDYEGVMWAQFAAMWDDTYLYVLVEAEDSVGMATHGHKFELYISTAYTRKFGAWMLPGYEAYDYQMFCAMQPEDSFYELGLYSYDVPLPSFQRANTVDGTRYVSEVRIAWADLGGRPADNGHVNSDYIGFEVHTQRNAPDGSNANRTKLGWAGVQDNAWASTEDWGTLRLLPAGGVPPPASPWAGVAADPATGAKPAGIGWINDTAYPFVYHYGAGGWLFIADAFSTLDGFYGYDFRNGIWFWSADALGGWHFNLTDPPSSGGGWSQW